MLKDVLTVVDSAGLEPTVVAPGSVAVDVPVVVDERGLTEAVNAVITDSTGNVAVVMADLALLTAEALIRLLTTEGEVVIAPGNGVGTNAVVVRHDKFRVAYHGTLFQTNRRKAAAIGADLSVVDSFVLGTDIDEPTDLIEVLVHNEGTARARLRSAGFSVETDDTGGVTLERDGRRFEAGKQMVSR